MCTPCSQGASTPSQIMESLLISETGNLNQIDRFQRKIHFVPVKKPFKGFSNVFNIETLNPTTTTSEQQPLTTASKKHEVSEFSEYGLDPELSFGITFRRIGAGLRNLGNTCFLNSVLQCLTYTAPLAAYLQSGRHKTSCHIAGFCALCAIQKHVSSALQSSGRILSPQDLVGNLRCISRNFRNARQEDAHEYMVNLLESMHKCCIPSGVPSESPGAYEKSLVHKIFGGRLRSQVKCQQCSYSSNKFDPFLDLSLEIFRADSLQKALTNFTASELLDGGERQYQCQRCKQKVRASKQLTIHKAPYVLTIHLKRFHAHDPGQKIKKKVHFGCALDLKPFVSGSYDGDVKYSLYGVLVHSGSSTHSGHYFCYVRTSNNMWYTLDDNRVSHVSEREVLNQQAYMLFYVRDRKRVAPRKPVDIAKEENITSNVNGNRDPSTSNNVLKEHPNGHVEAQKNLSNADDPSRVSCIKSALVQQNNIVKSVGSLTQSKIPLSELPSKTQTRNSSSQGLSVAKSEPECLSSFDHSGKEIINIPDNVKCLAAPDRDIGKLFNENAISKEGIKDSPSVEPNFSNPQTSNVEHSSDRTSQPQEKRIVAKFVAAAAHDSITDLSKTTGSITPLIQPNFIPQVVNSATASVCENACNEICKNGIDLQEGVLDDTLNNVKKMKKPKKKFLKYQIASMHLRPTLRFMTYLSPRKKKNHKRGGKQRMLGLKNPSKNKLDKHAISSDVEPSTSGKPCIFPSASCSSERKANKAGVDTKSTGESLVEDNAEGEFRKRLSQNCALLATSTHVENISGSSVVNGFEAGLQNDTTGQMHNSLMRMLPRGLEETVVARWDDIELPSSQPLESKNDQIAKIGYVGDEWDEDYDTGKRKKIRGLKNSFGGPNLFQQIATEKSRSKRVKLDQSISGNPPFRI